MAPDTPEPGLALEDQVEAERLRQFFARSIRSLPGTIYPALALWLFFFWLTRSPWCLAWAALVHSWQGVRLYRSRGRDRSGETLAQLRQAERRTRVQMVGFGLIWGSAPWVLMPGNDHTQLSVVVLMLVGVMSGSATGLAFSWRVGLGFMAALGAMLMGWMLWQRTVLDLVLAISTGVFTGSLLMVFRQQHLSLVRIIRAQIEQAEQARTLTRQKQELERLHQERSRLFATASHDLRQPVQALNLQARTLEQALAGHPMQATAQRMGLVTQSLSQSLDTVLDLHQLESLSPDAPAQALPAESLLFDAAQIWRDIAERRGLALRFHGLPLVLKVPRVTAQRVLNNLLDNALKYTTRGGVLVGVRLRCRPAGAVARIEVWDTGCGIAPTDQPQVFQPLFRAMPPAGVARPPGLGMGLNAVHRVCGQLGWPLGFRSRPGRGSVFWCELPLHDDPGT